MADNFPKYVEMKLPKEPKVLTPCHSIYMDSDNHIRCATYLKAIHISEFIQALGFECYAKAIPFSHDGVVIFGKEPEKKEVNDSKISGKIGKGK